MYILKMYYTMYDPSLFNMAYLFQWSNNFSCNIDIKMTQLCEQYILRRFTKEFLFFFFFYFNAFLVDVTIIKG